MNLKFITSVLVFIPFIWALYYLLKRRKYFQPVFPFGFAAIFLAIARTADVAVENPNLGVATWFGFGEESFRSFLSLLGDLADVVGVIFLVYGFVRAIESLHKEEERIEIGRAHV
jgi:hypothetical protein